MVDPALVNDHRLAVLLPGDIARLLRGVRLSYDLGKRDVLVHSDETGIQFDFLSRSVWMAFDDFADPRIRGRNRRASGEQHLGCLLTVRCGEATDDMSRREKQGFSPVLSHDRSSVGADFVALTPMIYTARVDHAARNDGYRLGSQRLCGVLCGRDRVYGVRDATNADRQSPVGGLPVMRRRRRGTNVDEEAASVAVAPNGNGTEARLSTMVAVKFQADIFTLVGSDVSQRSHGCHGSHIRLRHTILEYWASPSGRNAGLSRRGRPSAASEGASPYCPRPGGAATSPPARCMSLPLYPGES